MPRIYVSDTPMFRPAHQRQSFLHFPFLGDYLSVFDVLFRTLLFPKRNYTATPFATFLSAGSGRGDTMDRGSSKASFAVLIFLSLCALGSRALTATTKETLPCGRPKEVYVVRAIKTGVLATR